MEQAIIAIGSNLGNRLGMIRKAADFLERISVEKIKKSSIWESEPLGPARYKFLNCAALMTTEWTPEELLHRLKSFEKECGRDPGADRWAPRILDLDIIRFGEQIVQTGDLMIPHPEFMNRLFVLLPVQEIFNGYIDPSKPISGEEYILNAPAMGINKTDLKW